MRPAGEETSSRVRRRRNPRWLPVLWGIWLLFIGISDPAEARDERIADLTVTVRNTEILVSARLIRGFSSNTEEDLKNGIPKDLYYYILLKRRDPLWFDEEVLSKTVKYTVKYDLLKKQYQISRRIDRRIDSQVTEDFQTMKRLISSINGVRIATVDILSPADTYYISVKAEMKASRLPFYLEYFLFFIPFLEVDTPWANSSPFYKE